jgi:hypothetical protein
MILLKKTTGAKFVAKGIDSCPEEGMEYFLLVMNKKATMLMVAGSLEILNEDCAGL